MKSKTINPEPPPRIFPLAAWAVATTVLGFALSAQAALIIWDGDDNGNWNTGANWVGGTAPVAGDALQFAGSNTANNNDITADTSFSGIDFAAGASSFNLAGNRITLDGDVTNNSGNLQTIGLDMILGVTRTVTTSSGDITISGDLSGAGGLTKGNSAGILTLSGSNSFNGQLWTQRGTLSLNTFTGNGTGAIRMGTGFRSAVLEYTGTGETVARDIFNSSANDTYLDQNGTGNLEFSGN